MAAALALLLMVGLLAGGGAHAQNGPVLQVESQDANVGDAVDVPIQATDLENVGSIGLVITFDPDSLSFPANPSTDDLIAGAPREDFSANVPEPGELRISWFDDTNESPLTLADDTLVTLTFSRFDGESPVSFDKSNSEILDAEGNAVDPGFGDGVVSDRLRTLSVGTVSNATLGDTVTVALSGQDLDAAGSLSLKLGFDRSILAFAELAGDNSGLNLQAGAEDGVVTVGGFNSSGTSLGDSFAELGFVFKGGSSKLRVLPGSEVTDSTGAAVPTRFLDGSMGGEKPTLSLLDRTVPAGDTAAIPVQTSDLTNVGSVSLSVTFDSDSLSFVEAVGAAEGLNLEVGTPEPGHVRIGGFSVDGQAVDDALVDLRFAVDEALAAPDEAALQIDTSESELTAPDGTTYDARFEGGRLTVGGDILIDGRIDEPEYVGLGGNVDAADGFGAANDVDSLLYYPDPEREMLYVAVAGTLETNKANGYALWLNVTGESAPTGTASGESLGFPFEGTDHHYFTGSQGANTDFTADFEVDYALSVSPNEGADTTLAEAAAYTSDARDVTRIGTTDEQGIPGAGAGPGGQTVTFAHRNAEAPGTGAEFKIPFAELGGFSGTTVTASQNVEVFAVIVSSTGYFSNETIPGDATQIADGELDNGNPGNNATWDAYAGGPYHTSAVDLPVEMAAFDAQIEEDAVTLNWTTASETNNAGFRVQRMRAWERGSGSAWTTVGSVDGGGTTSEAQSYRFTDEELPYEADALTYRLKQVDMDGSVHFTDEVTVERGVTALQLLGTYPNPARQQATVRYALPEKQDVTVRLYDVLGRQVRTVVSGKQEGRHEQSIDVSGLSSGVYVLRLTAAGQTRTQKLTVVR